MPATWLTENGLALHGAAWRRRRVFLLLGFPLVLLAAVYVTDLIVTSGKVPRGVTAAGVPLGGLAPDEAEDRLRDVVGPRSEEPIPVTVGALDTEVTPRSIDLQVDARATVAQAGGQPLNPITRLTSFFVDTPVGVVSSVDDQALTATLEVLAADVAEDPVEGSIDFVDGEPVAADPESGQRLDVDAAAGVLIRDWALGGIVNLPMAELEPSTTAADVDAALRDVATPAVSAPVIVDAENDTRAILSEQTIASALGFEVEGGRLEPMIDTTIVVDALRPQLEASEVPGRNADIDFTVSPPAKTPEQAARRVDYDATLENLLPVLASDDDRELDAVYVTEPATFTMVELDGLGPIGVIGEFETSGFASDSGKNIRRAAEQIDGIVVGPGETFSLNEATNPRNAAAGYVEAGIIRNGRPARGVGGGVSQLATTLFNAAYFAGMEDVEHHEHSYYISRYPAGREATVFGDVLDVKFRNDGPTSVQIQTDWTPSSVTVRLVGIKRYEVTSSQSSRSRPTSPQTITIPAGEACSASGGASGFTITDTRTLRDIVTGETTTESHTVTYDPIPRVICGG
ncbi:MULTISPECIES: VanW family protein [Mycobacteriaceae]|uniref:VanW family protein n=1 Tax=Mycolicibacterium parafortuitum TaxID=39692 RepID=A0ACC6MDN1_MYCPF|nr:MULTISPECIES: VanW family protein [Mycobacteriaceae]MDZ5085061.1 VanW family protein [Mycolicibacterium parafortuitum]GFM20981.1 VanW family protein [Mycobacterium sp. PO1]GFM22055.1 VanW family protein [Mycobacterium sp. PO2]